MKLPRPYRDEPTPGGFKRVYWPQGDANDAYRGIRKSLASRVSKRGKPYSRDDQKKIAHEKWGEFCESHPQWRG